MNVGTHKLGWIIYDVISASGTVVAILKGCKLIEPVF
jgi:hypothetical protein